MFAEHRGGRQVSTPQELAGIVHVAYTLCRHSVESRRLQYSLSEISLDVFTVTGLKTNQKRRSELQIKALKYVEVSAQLWAREPASLHYAQTCSSTTFSNCNSRLLTINRIDTAHHSSQQHSTHTYTTLGTPRFIHSFIHSFIHVFVFLVPCGLVVATSSLCFPSSLSCCSLRAAATYIQ